jgi:hypothetical protein
MIRKGFTAAAAAWLALAGTAAHAQKQASKPEECITAPEAEAFFLAISPVLLRHLTDFCAKELPASSYLFSNPNYMPKFKTAATLAMPGAEVAMRKLVGHDMPDGMTLEGMMPMMDTVMGGMITDELKPKDCVVIDGLMSALDPLPAENLARTFILFAQIGIADKPDSDFPLCPLETNR